MVKCAKWFDTAIKRNKLTEFIWFNRCSFLFTKNWIGIQNTDHEIPMDLIDGFSYDNDERPT